MTHYFRQVKLLPRSHFFKHARAIMDFVEKRVKPVELMCKLLIRVICFMSDRNTELSLFIQNKPHVGV